MMTTPDRDRRIKVKVLVTLLVNPDTFSAEDVEVGVTAGVEAPGLSPWEAPELHSVEVFVDDVVWEDGSVVQPLPGWVE